MGCKSKNSATRSGFSYKEATEILDDIWTAGTVKLLCDSMDCSSCAFSNKGRAACSLADIHAHVRQVRELLDANNREESYDTRDC